MELLINRLKKIRHNAVIKIAKTHYLSLFIAVAALLNFLAGINIDMFAPSMPAIATYFLVSVSAVKSTIAISFLGWSLGCLIFGALIDSLGRKTIISFGLLVYIFASLLATESRWFWELMIFRFLQGFMVSTITIGCRALIIDYVKGKRYAIAMLYASLSYSCGALFGPYLGGILQHYLGWQANFLAFGMVGFVLLSAMILLLHESLPEKQPLLRRTLLFHYVTILKNKNFIAGIFVITLSNIELLLYPTLGPFLVEDVMHFDAMTYGYTALVVSSGYLMGALGCRYLLTIISLKTIYKIALSILLLTIFIAFLSAFLGSLNFWTLLLPFILVNVTVGFITPNVMGENLKLFPHLAGLAMSIQVSVWALLTALGLFIVSHIPLNSIYHLALMYSVLIFIQLIAFKIYWKNLNSS